MSRAFFSSLNKVSRGPTITRSGTIAVSETWSNQNVHITADTVFADDTTLTVNPGTNILFDGVFRLELRGSTNFAGSASNPIIVKPTPVTNTTGKFFGVWCARSIDGDAFNINGLLAGSSVNFSHVNFEDGDKTQEPNIGHRGRKRGGAIFILDSASTDLGVITIDNCSFLRCDSRENGGAVYFQADSFATDLTVSNCTFNNCKASQDGTGGWTGGAFQSSHPGNVTVTNNTFISCIAGTNWVGVGVTINAGTDTITAPASHNLYNGASVRMVGGTPPSPLVLNTEYFAIRTGDTTFKLASSKANAMSNTPIDLTTAGSSPTGTINQEWNIFDLQGTITVS